MSMVTFRQVLRNRDFFAIWLSQTVSSLGDWLALLALLSLVAFHMHGTPYQVSWILISFALPMALLGPVAGVLVDRWSPKTIMIVSDLARAAIAAMLVLPSGVYPIYALVFVLSAFSCFFGPAQLTALPRVVRREELLVANAANTQTTYLNKVIGPAAAGLLVSHFGENICFYLDSISFVLSAALLATVRLRGAKDGRPEQRTFWAEMAEGFRFMAGHRGIQFLAASVMMAVFAVSFFDALASVFVRDVLKAHPRTFGLLVSLVGAGTILAAWVVGRFCQKRSKSVLIASGILLMGTSVGVLSWWSNMYAAMVCALMLGMGIACIVVSAQTLLQEETPPEILGRASSGIQSLVTTAQVMGFVIAGYVGHWMGIREVFQWVAVAMLGTGAFAMARSGKRGKG